MHFRSQKGYTGTDIAVSVIVITIFISLIAVLIYRFNGLSDELQIKAKATEIAIDEIEFAKGEGFEQYVNKNSEIVSDDDAKGTTIEGFYKTILVEDYTDIGENDENKNKVKDLVKRVTVTISYMYRGKENKVELSTILSKEN